VQPRQGLLAAASFDPWGAQELGGLSALWYSVLVVILFSDDKHAQNYILIFVVWNEGRQWRHETKENRYRRGEIKRTRKFEEEEEEEEEEEVKEMVVAARECLDFLDSRVPGKGIQSKPSAGKAPR
jgi:hypothetical protein